MNKNTRYHRADYSDFGIIGALI